MRSKRLLLSMLLTTSACPSTRAAESDPPALQTCLARALASNPTLAARRKDAEAAGYRARQAAGRPDPRLTAEAENFAGRDTFSGTDAAEFTVGIEQAIEPPGRGSGRRAAAQAERMASERELAAAELDLARQVREAFADALAARARVELAEESLRLASEFHATLRARADAGQVPPLEAERAGAEEALAGLAAARVQREQAAACDALAALWGDRHASFSRVVGDLLPPSAAVPADDELARLGERGPDVALAEAECERFRALIEVARSEARPDVEIGAGVRRFEETGDTAFVAGFSLGLPVAGRARDGIRAATLELHAAEERLAAEKLRALAETREARRAVESLRHELELLRDRVLPAAERAHAAAVEGHRQGRFGYLEVLDARRALLDARKQVVEATADSLRAQARLERYSSGAAGARGATSGKE